MSVHWLHRIHCTVIIVSVCDWLKALPWFPRKQWAQIRMHPQRFYTLASRNVRITDYYQHTIARTRGASVAIMSEINSWQLDRVSRTRISSTSRTCTARKNGKYDNDEFVIVLFFLFYIVLRIFRCTIWIEICRENSLF